MTRPVDTPVLIAGGGPVGLTLARVLALRGVRSVLAERNESTTRHPKMDITNGRTMELFRRLGMTERMRAAGVPEDHPFDVSWITTLSGHELTRFRYPSPARAREIIRFANDGSGPREPALRVSQVVIEPVLKSFLDEDPREVLSKGVDRLCVRGLRGLRVAPPSLLSFQPLPRSPEVVSGPIRG